MKGHITQRSKNSWSIVIYLGKDKITNQKKYKWFTYKGTKTNAEKFLTEKLHELNNGICINPKKMSLEEYLQYWYHTCCITNLSPNTYESYKKNIRLHKIKRI